jgi:hypothetical protein
VVTDTTDETGLHLSRQVNHYTTRKAHTLLLKSGTLNLSPDHRLHSEKVLAEKQIETASLDTMHLSFLKLKLVLTFSILKAINERNLKNKSNRKFKRHNVPGQRLHLNFATYKQNQTIRCTRVGAIRSS